VRVILLESIEKLGKVGSVVKVADGYARNFLIPRNYAVIADKKNLQKIEAIKLVAEKKELEHINALKALAQKIEGIELVYQRKADENDHLYGSVSDVDIVQSLKEKGFEIHKSMIRGEKHIKALGDYDVGIHLASDVDANIKVIVENEE